MNNTSDRVITWTVELEKFFKNSGEKALCLSSLHKHSEKVYAYRRTFIDLPVIVLNASRWFIVNWFFIYIWRRK